MSDVLFESFDAAKATALKDSYRTLATEAEGKIAEFTAHKDALFGDAKTAFDELHGHATQAKQAVASLPTDATPDAIKAATELASKSQADLVGFVKGETAHILPGTEKAVKLGEGMGQELRDSFIAAEQAAAKVTKPVNGRFLGIARTQEKGWSTALKKNTGEMNFLKEGMTAGQRGKAFAHGSAVVGAAIGLGDAVFRSKNSDGEDRSGASRVIEAVGAGALGTFALLGGRATAAARI